MSAGDHGLSLWGRATGRGITPCPACSILGTAVHATSYAHASDLMLDRAKAHASRRVPG